MSIDPESLRLQQELEAALRGVTDQAVRDIVAAWAMTWDEISRDLTGVLVDMLLAGDRVTATQLRRSIRLRRALVVAKDRLEALTTATGVRITRDLQAVIDTAGAAQASVIDSQLPAGTDLVDASAWSRVDPDQLDAIVDRSTEQITSRLAPLAAETTDAIRRELVRGVAAGTNPRVTARRMVDRAGGHLNLSLTRALTIARTETLDAHRAAAQVGQAQHADVLAGWVWLASLSPRTCAACWGMHGEEFGLEVPGPQGHQNCRCSRMPKTKPWSDLGFDGIEEPPPVFGDPDALFATLPPADQQRILGGRGYQAWLAGEFPRSKWAVRRRVDGWRDSMVPAKPPLLQAGGGVRVPPPPTPPPGMFTGPDAPRPGRVSRDKGVRLEAHEVASGYRIASLGMDVHFLIPAGGKTADARILGQLWEIKAPIGASERTIRNKLRDATDQADRAIVDLFRTTLTAADAEAQIARYFGDRARNGRKALEQVWVLPDNVREHTIWERP